MSSAAREAATSVAERAEATLRWWEGQAREIERDRTRVKKILPYGLLLSFVFAPFSAKAALLVFGTAALATLQGLYLVTVHRWEYAHNVVEAKKELWMARKSVLAQEEMRPMVPAPRAVAYLGHARARLHALQRTKPRFDNN